VMDLAEGLLARDCEVHLIYSPRRMDKVFADRLAKLRSLKSVPLPMRRSIHPGDFAMVRAVRRYLRESGPFDVIHGHSSKGGAIARLAAIGSGVPAFYTIHGLVVVDPSLARWKRLMYRSIEVLLSQCSARIIAVSPEEERNAIRSGMGEARLICIPNGIGALEFTARDEARRAIGVGEQDVVVGFVGRLVDQKAPDVLLRAFARVAGAASQARLVMVGSGPLEDSLRQLASDLRVAERITWLGERDAREVFAAFDLFAISSRKEGLPYVVLEAMQAGLPVVATDSSGVELLVEPGSNGMIVPCGDVNGFAEAMLEIIRDAERRARFGLALQQKSKLFTVERMVAQTLAAYESAIDERVEYEESPLAAEGELP
jgi:glycosyltransferase involved in cell wall biosynthesis